MRIGRRTEWRSDPSDGIRLEQSLDLVVEPRYLPAEEQSRDDAPGEVIVQERFEAERTARPPRGIRQQFFKLVLPDEG